MFRTKAKLQLSKIFLFFSLGLIFISNNSVIAMKNNNKKQQKEDYELFDEAIDNLNEGIKYFSKKGIQINLNKITTLLSIQQIQNDSTTKNSSSNYTKNKKIKLC
ncbi:MAG: SVM family protein ['Waltheria sp.' little leaf phytoplasma]|nr:SVM family protein ['Waltheria sp.' little leaf phytoplasma]